MEERKDYFVPEMDLEYCEEKEGVCPIVIRGWWGYIHCPLHICKNCLLYQQALKEVRENDKIDQSKKGGWV